MAQAVTKISTIYRKEREKNPTIFEQLRNEFLTRIVEAKPNYDPKIIVSNEPF